MPSRRSKPSPSVSAVVLASGESRRFGRNKLLEEVPGGTIVEHTLSALICDCIQQVIVVATEEVAKHLAGSDFLTVDVVTNDFPGRGISLSIRLGISSLRPVDGVLMVLADMPLVSQDVISTVVGEFDGASIVVSSHGSRPGNPVLFPWILTGELLTLKGDKGGRAVIERHPELVKLVEVADDSVLIDIDTVDDLTPLVRRLEDRDV
jgi:molybdenum cofactor cytidylyltransferase